MDCEELEFDRVVSSGKLYARRNLAMDGHKKTTDLDTLAPSEYIQRFSLNPESIVCNVNKCREKKCSVFTPNPKMVVFPKFEIGNVYRMCISVSNTSKYPHYIKLLKSEDVAFDVTFKGSTLNTRLAAGMTLTYEVKFHPDEKRDYFHDIIFQTDNESLNIPVVAIGPRALLSFPDEINMERTAVKIAKTKPFLMRNIGDISTGFSIFSDNPTFTICPSKGSLNASEALQIQISYTPTNTGITNDYLFLRYECGHTVRSVIYGEAEECDVRVLNDNIEIENTYLGLSRQFSIEIQNNSDYIIDFEWVRYKSIEEDQEQKERYKETIDPVKSLPFNTNLSASTQELMCQRIYFDNAQSLTAETFAFCDENFELFPMNGKIWPRNSTNVVLTFTPNEVNNISTLSYLEIKGLENRIPVSLKGKCVGPALELNFLSLDVQEVYLCSDYNYEIVCKNDGPIPGTLQYVQKEAIFGSSINVEPNELIVDVDELKTLKLIFCSDRTGNFVERVDFVIKESSEVLSFVMKGTVICPIVRVNDEQINFHTASIGFTMQKQLCYRNLSHKPIEFSIRAIDDGYEDPVTHEEFAQAQKKPEFPVCPREFSMSPSEGIIEPKKSMRIKLFYTPNVVRSEDVLVQVCLCKSPNAEPLLFPVNCDAKAASFQIDPPEVNIPPLFINFPYCINLKIINDSDVEGYFYFIPQEVLLGTPVIYSLSIQQGYLKPGELKEVALTIIIKSLGQQEITLKLLSLGFETPIPCCKIVCCGEGPIVCTESCYLNWGEVDLLQRKYLTFKITNDSPISAEFNCAFKKYKSIWQVEPSFGELEANETLELTVSVFLKDKGKYYDYLSVYILDGDAIEVKLLATGIGSSIIFKPEILPEFDMGVLFCKEDINIPFTIKNGGNKHHYVLFTNVQKVQQTKNVVQDTNNTKFKIEPNIIELAPGSEMDLQVQIRWNINESISEQWYIFATIDNQGKRELIGASTFKATFIKPNVTFNKNELSFRLDIGQNYELLQQEDELEIKNESGLKLNAHFTIESPFIMIADCNCHTNSLDITLKDENVFTIKVYFPFDIENSEPIAQTYNGCINIKYDEHNKIDTIPCTALIYFPHLDIIPNKIDMYCEVGYSTEEQVKLVNDSPLPVFFKMEWLKESFVYQNLSPVSERESEEMASEENYLAASSISSLKYKNERLPDTHKNCNRNSSHVYDSQNFYDIDGSECEEGVSIKSSSEHTLFSIDLLDRFLQITPEEGQIYPFSDQFIYLTFNGFENAKVSAQAICKIARGPTLIINVTATADFIRCQLKDHLLDYGIQLYCESSIRALKIMNQCMIPLCWNLETSSNLLLLVEGPQMLEPVSENLILIERVPSPPGLYNEKLILEIPHLEPFVINAQWLATMPQIYIDVSRIDAFEKYPVEFGYRAIQLLISESTIHADETMALYCSASDITNETVEFSEYEKLQLIEDNWLIIDKEVQYCSQVDIDMAFERIIVRDHMKSYKNDIHTLYVPLNNDKDSSLHTPSYSINMGFVIVGQTAQISIPLHNYGYEKAKIKFRKDEKKQKLFKTCFFVKFKQNVEICQCENSVLNVIFCPKKDIFVQNKFDVSYKFYLEIKNGLTIPIHIKATAGYPNVTITTETLDFKKVFVGHCKHMSFLLRNSSPTECEWQLFIENSSKNSTKLLDIFYAENINGILSADEETIIKVFFQPYKNGYQEANLVIRVLNNEETKMIKMFGFGSERKLKINTMNVIFPPVLPNTTVDEDLIIENKNAFPIHIYWHHLTNFSEINMIVRILKHYYNKNEILVPQTRKSENIYLILISFYYNLIKEMSSDNEFKNLIEKLSEITFLQSKIFDVAKTENDTTVEKPTTEKFITGLNKASSIDDDFEQIDYLKLPSLSLNFKSHEIEALLHAYINKLHKDPKFSDTIKHPLKDLFETNDSKESFGKSLNNAEESEKSLVIIFYGAPFTDYQETACRSARSLNLPLLNLNKIFLEALDCSQSESAKKVADQIDKRYDELITKFEKINKIASTSSKPTETLINVYDKIMQILKKVLPEEELIKMDCYSVYEYKLEMITFISSLTESLDSSTISKGKRKPDSKAIISKKQSVLSEISPNLCGNILRDSISQMKFKNGYVLQTLNNEFIKNEVVTLKTLLEATEKSKYYLFISFFNSYELYERRYQKLHPRDVEDFRDSEETFCADNYDIQRESPMKSKQVRKKTSFLKQTITEQTESKDAKNLEYIIPGSDKIMKEMNDYQINLNNLLEVISGRESRHTVKNKSTKKSNQKLTTDSFTDKFFIWHIYSHDPWDKKMYEAIILQILLNFKDTIKNSTTDELTAPLLPSCTYTILKEYELFPESSNNQMFSLLEHNVDFTSEVDEALVELPESQQCNTEIQKNLEAQLSFQPQELRKFKLRFRPTEEGHFSGEFNLGLIDNVDAIYKIKIEGIAALPKLNMTPYSLFDRVKNTKLNNSHEPTYFLDTRKYDFGSLLISKTKERIHKKVGNITLRNNSVVLANVVLSLENENSEDFDIRPCQITIKPNEVELIEVTACASKLGVTAQNLILSIQNSKNETIQLQSNGIELNVDIDPKQIKLDRVLLYRTEKRILTIQNRSEITIHWHLSVEDTNSTITLSSTTGKIKHESSCEIELQYYADNVSPIRTIFVICELFLDQRDSNPIKTSVIAVTAQNYELLFDLQAENPLDFKAVTVGSVNNLSFTITNYGVYDVAFEIEQRSKEVLKKLCDSDVLSILEQDFNIYPSTGIIQTKKQTIINVTFTPSAETTLKYFPLLDCMIIEPYGNVGVVNQSIINVSAISYYIKFRIEPHPQLNFGTLGLRTSKTMQLKIQNTGCFPLTYSIISQLKTRASEGGSNKKRNRSVGETGSIKARNRSLVKVDKKSTTRSINFPETSLTCGPFNLEKSHGELEPDHFDIITTNCWSDTIGHFEETIIFLVADSLPADSLNREVSIVADVCVAEIDFKNYKDMFPESYVVESIDDFDCPHGIDAYTIFSCMNKCLYFDRICVENTHVTTITLQNMSTVCGVIIIELIEDLTSTNTFTIDRTKLTIPPMDKQSFKLSFTPTVLGVFLSTLTFKLDLPSDLDTQIITIDLHGEGCVPHICILDPVTVGNNNSELHFGMILLSNSHEKIIKIENTGQVTASITIQILKDLQTVYSIFLDENKNKLLCGCANDENGQREVVLRLFPNEIANIRVLFTPKSSEKYKSLLKFLIENNPYENLAVRLIGTGFDALVVFENLEVVDSTLSSSVSEVKSLSNSVSEAKSREQICAMRRLRNNSSKNRISLSRISSKTSNGHLLSYKLDYGMCFLNRMSKINFRIKNKTKNQYFKFEWNSHQNIVCLPEAGHVAPESFKEVTATFLAKESVSLSQVPLECAINQITFNEPPIQPCWDSRQMDVNWIEKHPQLDESDDSQNEETFLQKTISKTAEPKIQVVPETTRKIQLLVSAVSDYSDYSCDVEVIDFDDTLMLQSREYKFTLKNTGVINLDYSWELTMDEQYPIRLNQTHICSNLILKSCFNEGNESAYNTSRVNYKESGRKYRPHNSGDIERSDLFSSTAGLTDRSTDSWMEGENCPFEIIPKAGTLASNEVVECIFKFAPVDVFEYKAHLRCKMDNLNPSKTPPNIVVTAKSLLPYCHFEIEDSDYITNGRRDITLPGPPGYSIADPETISNMRVVEFKMLGIGTCHIGCIHLINPTSEDYCYNWSILSNEMENRPAFQCSPQAGLIEKGKRCKIEFSHIAEKVGFYESFWQFEIKKYNLKTLFLIVANVYEPAVKCINKIINMAQCGLGEIKCSAFEIDNNENCPLSFDIVPDSLYSEKGKFQVISVYPMAGILKPNSSQIFNAEYKSSLIGEHTFDVHCNIENLSKSLNIVFTTQVLESLSKVVYIDDTEQEIDMIENSTNVIDIGQIMLGQSKKIKFKIINDGQLDINFSWILNNSQDDKCRMSFCENSGTVQSNSSSICYLVIIASEKINICNQPATLHIQYGPTYRFKLNAIAKKRPIEFSFSSHDFGPCYIETHDGYLHTTELVIINNQKVSCSIKRESEDKLHLKLGELPCMIPANKSVKVVIHFRPMAETIYRDVIRFLISDTMRKDILIQGEGIPYKIRLKDPCEALIDFGTITVGKCLCQKIHLINNGRLPATVKVMLKNCLSKNTPKTEEKIESSYLQPLNPVLATTSSNIQISSDSMGNLNLEEFFEILPITFRNLKPSKEMEITIKFKAAKKAHSMTAQLGLAVNNSIFHLAHIKAHCVEASYYLSRSYISFGTIFESCTAEEKLILVNDGDISMRFNWKTESLKPHFDIVPVCGCCSAGSEITFTCIFKPTQAASCLKSEAILEIKKYKKLFVTITGNCRPIPEPTDAISFKAEIGQSDVQQIEIQNDSDQPWTLIPVLTGEYFTMDKSLFLDPKSNKLFDVTYRPLRKCPQQRIHKGKLVILTPTGKKAILYELNGSPSEAKIAEKLCTRKIPAKKRFSETFVIRNSKNRSQMFNCKVNELLPDNSTITHTADQIIVNARDQFDYKCSFLFEKEGVHMYKITIEDSNGHVRCHNFEFTVTKPEIAKKIELTTYVRCAVLYNLKIENLSKLHEVTYEVINDNEDITVHGLPVVLAPCAFRNIQIEYLPLIACKVKTMLEIVSEVFGSLFYELHLTAKAAPPEKVTHIKSILGNSINFKLRLKNCSKKDCEYNIEVNKTAFHCPKMVTVGSNQTFSLEVRFEPDCFETVNATITAKSITAGEFIFPIVGLCAPPRPQGPFEVTTKAPTVLNFKNVFNKQKTFEFAVDNGIFTIDSQTAAIESKAEKNILVSLRDARRNKSNASVGKLTVTSTCESLSAIKWIYYLKGVVADE